MCSLVCGKKKKKPTRERLSCALQKVVFHSGHVTKYPVDGCPEKKIEKMRVVKKKKMKEQREKMTDVGWKKGGDYKFIIRRVQQENVGGKSNRFLKKNEDK